MAVKTKMRIVAFVSPAIVEQYTQLSRQYWISRSELYRLVLQRGFKSIAAWCEKTQEALMDPGLVPRGEVSSAPMSVDGSTESDAVVDSGVDVDRLHSSPG